MDAKELSATFVLLVLGFVIAVLTSIWPVGILMILSAIVCFWIMANDRH